MIELRWVTRTVACSVPCGPPDAIGGQMMDGFTGHEVLQYRTVVTADTATEWADIPHVGAEPLEQPVTLDAPEPPPTADISEQTKKDVDFYNRCKKRLAGLSWGGIW